MPNQPWSASFCQKASVIAAGSAMRWRTKAEGHSFSRNFLALARSSSCSWVKPISMLPSAAVPAAVEPHHVAEMRPQTLRPGGIRGLAPFGRARHFRRSEMVERDVALDGTSAAVAAGTQGAGHRAEGRDVLPVVPLVEIALVLGGDIHRDDQQSRSLRGCRAVTGKQLLALIAHQALAEASGAPCPRRGILASDGQIGRALQHADIVEIVSRDRDLRVRRADPAITVQKTGYPQPLGDVLEIVPVVKFVFGGGREVHCRNQDALCHRSLPRVWGIIAETGRRFQRNDRRWM